MGGMDKKVEINIPDGRKLRLPCLLQAYIPKKINFGYDKVLVTKSKTFKYDTGAQITCLPAQDLGIDIGEEKFKNYDRGGYSIEGIGIDEESKIIYYLLQVEKFTVAGIELGSVPIYITFDTRATKRLLGMDIIKLMNIEMNFDTKKAIIYMTDRFKNFKKTKLRLELKDMYEMGIYSSSDYKTDIDLQGVIKGKPKTQILTYEDLEANFVMKEIENDEVY